MKKQKPVVILSVTGLVLVIAYFLYDHFRPRCDTIFEQTTAKLGTNLEFIKAKGELFVGRDKVQDLAEGPQKVALHLKACCVAQQSAKMSPEQTQACINGAKDYESKVLQVTSIIREAQAAKDQGNQQLVDQKSAQAKEAVSAASRSVSELGALAAAINSGPNHPGSSLADGKAHVQYKQLCEHGAYRESERHLGGAMGYPFGHHPSGHRGAGKE